jgi:type I restriction-modification system DNA methylase subunit
MTPWDFIKHLTVNKTPWKSYTEDEKNDFNSYMIHKVLSMDENYIELANIVQKMPPTSKEQIYNVYLNILPKKPLYSKYIKSTTKSYSSELLTQIANYFQCSKKEASEYITILSKSDVENILTELGSDDKVKKTLLKELK